MNVAYRSDRGIKRPNNEDSVYVDVESGIFILADGMGGHNAGEVASEMAVQKAYEFIKAKLSGLREPLDYKKCFIEAVTLANDAVRQAGLADRAFHGMGTTLLLAVFEGGRAHLCTVGDSRAYLLNGSIRQLTKDQTVGAFLIEHNLMNFEDIDPSHWHVLIQAVGATEELEPELIEVDLQKDDILLLCSDGLTDMLSDEEITSVFKKCGGDLNLLADSLVSAANGNGGYDNISLIVISL
jgi:protein phosphatase